MLINIEVGRKELVLTKMFADKVFFVLMCFACSVNAVKYPYAGYGGYGGVDGFGGYSGYGLYGKPATSYVEVEKSEAAPIYGVPAEVPVYGPYGQHGAYPKYQYGAYAKYPYGKDYYAYPKYQFNYGVHDPHTGDYKTQDEIRDGDVVKGSYSVADPDGTLRTVHYTADDLNGFNAVVSKQGHAVHPVPVYHKPYLAVPKSLVAEQLYEHY